MLQLEFDKTDVKLLNFNPRAELHGEDKKLAADLKIEAGVTADVLAEFHPSLRAFLFNKDSLDLAEGEAMRFSRLGLPLTWDDEMTGAKFSIHYGVGSSKPLVLGDVTVNQFRIEPRNGGSVLLTLRVQCHPTPKQAGDLADLIGSTINISLEPMELAEIGEAPATPKKTDKADKEPAQAGLH